MSSSNKSLKNEKATQTNIEKIRHDNFENANKDQETFESFCRECDESFFRQHGARKIKDEAKLSKNLENIALKDKDIQTEIALLLGANDIQYFYHFTDIRNIPLIRETGGLLSTRLLRERKKDVIFGGNDFSLTEDKKKGLDRYVRLSFCSDHPMAWHLFKRTGSKVVLLRIDTRICDNKTLFSNINAIDARAVVRSGLEGLNLINFDAVKKTYISHDDPVFKNHQAEILIPNFIPIKYIVNIDKPEIIFDEDTLN